MPRGHPTDKLGMYLPRQPGGRLDRWMAKCEAALAPPGCQGRRVNEQGMSDRFSATQLAARQRPILRMSSDAATPGVARRVALKESFEGPSIVRDLAMLLGLYRDLLALAVWRGIGRRLPQQAHELNSPTYILPRGGS